MTWWRTAQDVQTALKKPRVGQHAQTGRSIALVRPRDVERPKVFADDPLGGARLFDFRDQLDRPPRRQRGEEIAYRWRSRRAPTSAPARAAAAGRPAPRRASRRQFRREYFSQCRCPLAAGLQGNQSIPYRVVGCRRRMLPRPDPRLRRDPTLENLARPLSRPALAAYHKCHSPFG